MTVILAPETFMRITEVIQSFHDYKTQRNEYEICMYNEEIGGSPGVRLTLTNENGILIFNGIYKNE